MTNSTLEQPSPVEQFKAGIEHLRDKELGRLGIFGTGATSSYEILDLPEGNGLYAAPGPLLENIEGLHPNRLSFEPTSAREVGKQDSRNGVFFGDLTLRSFEEGERVIAVAVKPFAGRDKQQFLANELQAMEDIDRLGLQGVKPLGVFRDGDISYLISLFERKVISLDSIDWRNLSEELKKQTVHRGLISLLELHTRGRVHGDANPRNITIQPNLAANWHVDLEHSQDFAEDPVKLVVGIKRDILDYYSGLCKLQDKRSSFENLVDEILYPYSHIATILAAESDGARLIVKLLPALIKEIEREFTGEPMKQDERKQFIKDLGLL